MKIIKYATASKHGFETFDTEVDWRKHMKTLHEEKVSFVPRVLVEGKPGTSEAQWLNSNEYNRLQKKEGKHDKI